MNRQILAKCSVSEGREHLVTFAEVSNIAQTFKFWLVTVFKGQCCFMRQA